MSVLTTPRAEGRGARALESGVPGLPRLLSAPADLSFAAHVAHWGPPGDPADLGAELGRSQVRGRGGAGFPIASKMAAVRRAVGAGRRRAVVVVNGSEGEPLSAKDRLVLSINPHLVIDGALAAARAVGADRALLCVKRSDDLAPLLVRCAADRTPGPLALEIVTVPDHYLVGEESALLNWIANRRARPTLTPPRPAERGIEGRPTLVANVETLANVALVARFGAPWFGAVGTQDDPGSMLVTVSGGARPVVLEVPFDTTLVDVLTAAGVGLGAGVLVGGYFGTWLAPGDALAARLSPAGLEPFGAGLGCGVLAVMPPDICPLNEVARVTRWLADQSAGQCGPCRNGLPAIASALGRIADGGAHGATADVSRWAAMIAGRGACRMPDGAIRFVQSALAVFADHLEVHTRGESCPLGTTVRVLTTPPFEELR